jgi:hypothetical protein
VGRKRHPPGSPAANVQRPCVANDTPTQPLVRRLAAKTTASSCPSLALPPGVHDLGKLTCVFAATFPPIGSQRQQREQRAEDAADRPSAATVPSADRAILGSAAGTR